MEWTDVLARVAGGENETTEFKQWPGANKWPEKIGPTLCGMANGQGGLIVIGVADDGALAGVPDSEEEVQEKLTSFLQSGLSAPARAGLGRHLSTAGWIHWIDVRRASGPVPLQWNRRVYVRRGRASVEASQAELQDLYNRFGFVLTEEQVVDGTTPSDIDLALFHTFLARQGLDLTSAPQPDPTSDLRNRGVVAGDDGADEATVYGLVCFGRQPQQPSPLRNACISMSAYAGRDRAASIILKGDALGTLKDQVERALGWMKALGQTEQFEGAVRTDRPLLPERAMREALVNAVAHRDYSIVGSRILLDVYEDRADVISPGELPNHMTEAAVMAGGLPRSRNQAIAHYLQVSGLMESRGRGFPIIRRALRDFNGREPRLENNRDGRFVRLTLPR